MNVATKGAVVSTVTTDPEVDADAGPVLPAESLAPASANLGIIVPSTSHDTDNV